MASKVISDSEFDEAIKEMDAIYDKTKSHIKKWLIVRKENKLFRKWWRNCPDNPKCKKL